MSDLETTGLTPELSAVESIRMLDEVVENYREIPIREYPHQDQLQQLAASAGFRLNLTNPNIVGLQSEKGMTTEYSSSTSTLHVVSSLVNGRMERTGEICATEAIVEDYPSLNLVTVDPYLVVGAHLRRKGISSEENSYVYSYNDLAERVRVTKKILQRQMPEIAGELEILDLGGSSCCVYTDKQKEYVYKVYTPNEYSGDEASEVTFENFTSTPHAVSLMKEDILQTAALGKLGIGPQEKNSVSPFEENGFIIPAIVGMEYVDIGHFYDVPEDQYLAEAHRVAKILTENKLQPSGALEIHWDKRKQRLICLDLVEMQTGTQTEEEHFEELLGQYQDAVNRKYRYRLLK